MGFTPQLTAGVWVGYDDKQISLGKRESGALAALPIWMEFMEQAMAGAPPLKFPNVITLEEQADEHHVRTDVPDTAPEEELPAPREKPVVAAPPAATPPPAR
jgi:penicillin-binding protein 1A